MTSSTPAPELRGNRASRGRSLPRTRRGGPGDRNGDRAQVRGGRVLALWPMASKRAEAWKQKSDRSSRPLMLGTICRSDPRWYPRRSSFSRLSSSRPSTAVVLARCSRRRVQANRGPLPLGTNSDSAAFAWARTTALADEGRAAGIASASVAGVGLHMHRDVGVCPIGQPSQSRFFCCANNACTPGSRLDACGMDERQ
jgi:hypothetical protein